jgi:hypothetical protein
MTEIYSRERATAIHEAGHAVMAYLLGRPFASISVVENDGSLGRVTHRRPGDWFRPDIEIDGRARNMIEDHVMIYLAGAETESAWAARCDEMPDDLEDRINQSALSDRAGALDLAHHFCGGVPELEAYLEWLRQRVLGWTGRGAEFDVGKIMNPVMPEIEERMRYGDPRFWALAAALADAVQAARSLTWRRARKVLHDADPLLARIRELQDRSSRVLTV